MKALLDSVIPKGWFARVILLGLLIFIAVGVARSRIEYSDIEVDPAEVPGTLIRYERSGRSGSEAWFQYYVEGVSYEIAMQQAFKDCRDTRWCIGERYMMRYSRRHPENAEVLWEQHLPRTEE